ncbi:MAG: hypothetical protein WBD40_04940 [Tepidisphaeraceae bacterium]
MDGRKFLFRRGSFGSVIDPTPSLAAIFTGSFGRIEDAGTNQSEGAIIGPSMVPPEAKKQVGILIGRRVSRLAR